LSAANRDGQLVDELRTELALIRRDLVDRLRRLEEYINLLESDVSRLRLDIQRVSDKLSDSVERGTYIPKVQTAVSTIQLPREAFSAPTQQATMEEVKPAAAPIVKPAGSPVVEPPQAKSTERKDGLNPTEIAIIKYLIENPTVRGATPIGKAVCKAREHVARTLKKLSEEGVIIRDESTWPKSYIVPDEVKARIMGQVPAQ